MAFQRGSARRAFADDETDDVLCSVASASAARRVVAEPIGFDADEPLTSTRRLPRITETAQPVKAAKDSVRLRRGLLGVAAAATASAALVLPSAMSTVTAQPATIDAATVERTVAVSRSVERAELVTPVTEAEAQASADAEAAVLAEQERLAAAEEADRAAEAARIAEEERLAAEAKAAEDAAAAQTAAAAATTTNQAGSTYTGVPTAPAVSSGTCAYGDGSNLGLTYQAQAAFQVICAQFPNVTSYGGWRASADDHGAGQAIDIMISGSAGWDIANFLVANASALHVEYVIYSQQIWGNWGGGFTYMEDRGSITQNHYDHVHVTIR